MTHPPEPNEVARFVSTGGLPTPDEVGALVTAAYERHAGNRDGAPSDVYPALSGVAPDLFGVAVASVNRGCARPATQPRVHDHERLEAVRVRARCGALGRNNAARRLGINSTGLPFDSVIAVELTPTGATNPMVNAGRDRHDQPRPGRDREAKWELVVAGSRASPGRDLALDEEVYESESATNRRNRGLAHRSPSYGRIDSDPTRRLDLYTRQCSLRGHARGPRRDGRDARRGGVNPLTGERSSRVRCRRRSR